MIFYVGTIMTALLSQSFDLGGLVAYLYHVLRIAHLLRRVMSTIVRFLWLRGVLQALDLDHILLLPRLILPITLVLGWLGLCRSNILCLSRRRGYQILLIFDEWVHFLASGGATC